MSRSHLGKGSDTLNQRGPAYLTHTAIPMPDGATRYAIRVAIGATTTRDEHVRALFEQMAAVATAIVQGG